GLPPSLATLNGVRQTLYQNNYHSEKSTVYQSPAPLETKVTFGYGGRSPQKLYKQPKSTAEQLDYPAPLKTVIYETSSPNDHV
ncbi:MAG: hypothetical protein AAGI45_25330, partial [Cyanobacteria bacterium P01_H01_bin.26]